MRQYTPETWLAGFLLASDTGGDDLTATGDRWRKLQVGIRSKFLRIFTNLVSTCSPELDLNGTLFDQRVGV